MQKAGWLLLSLGMLAVAAVAQQPAAPTNAQTQSSAPAVKPAHPPVLISAPDPDMPQKARDKKESGTCVVRTMVDIEGKPKDLQVLRCSDPIFEPNTLEALAQFRFRPATDDKGNPVATRITIEVNFRTSDDQYIPIAHIPTPRIAYAFGTPPGTTSFDPDANGIYPLSKLLELPEFTHLNDKGYDRAVMSLDEGVSCLVLLTIDPKGKPSDPKLLSCDEKNLEKPAVDTLMNSQFKPAKLSGKPVAVRTSIRLVYKGFAPMR
jgi:TonB family protein